MSKSIDYSVRKFDDKPKLDPADIRKKHKEFLRESESYEQQFSEIVRQLNERRENKNVDFYEQHLQSEYKMLGTGIKDKNANMAKRTTVKTLFNPKI